MLTNLINIWRANAVNPATKTQQYWLYVITLAALLVLWYLYFVYLTPIAFPFDDPYIVVHNAEVLHQGFDTNYVGSPALSGTTSLLHLALVALLMFFLAPLTALITVTWLAVIVYALGLLRLAFTFQASVLQAYLFLISGLTIGYTSYQLFNGLETGLMLATLIWALIFATEFNKRFFLLIFCGLLPFVRPELSIFSVFIFLYSSYQAWCGKSLTLKKIGLDAIIVLLIALPWLLWCWFDLGEFFPNTLQSKVAFFAITAHPLLFKLYFSWSYFAAFILVLGVIGFFAMVFFSAQTSLGRLGLLYITIILFFYAWQFPLAFRDYIHRYLYIILPFLLYALISGIQHRDKNYRRIAGWLLIWVCAQSLWNFPVRWHTYLNYRAYRLVQQKDIAQWSQQHLPADALIVINDAGYLAYATKFRLIDYVGLKTPEVVVYHQLFTAPSGGQQRGQALAAIIKKYHANYIIISSLDLLYSQQLAAQGLQLQLLYASPYAYWVYRIITSD